MTNFRLPSGFAAVLASLGLSLGLAAAPAQAWESDPIDVSFTNAGGVNLTGQLFVPATLAPAGGRPAVVMLHGCSGLWYTGSNGSVSLGSQFRQWADWLTAYGVVVLAVDSFTPRNAGNQCGNGAGVGVSEIFDRPQDAMAAREFLAAANLLQVNTARIGLLGWSHGGSTVLTTLATKQPVQSTQDSPLAAGSPFRVGVAFYPGGGLADNRCAKYKTDGTLQTTSCYGGLSTSVWDSYAPLAVFHGSADTTTSPTSAATRVTRAQASAGGASVALTLYSGATHSFDEPTVGGGTCVDTASTPNACAKTAADASALATLLAWLQQ